MADFRGRSRRNFLTQCLTGAVALGAGSSLRAAGTTCRTRREIPRHSRVVIARDPELHGTGSAPIRTASRHSSTAPCLRSSPAIAPQPRPKTPSPHGGMSRVLVTPSV